jgi:hypothetical protein
MPKEQFTDAIMLLKHDHREVENLFSKFQKASGKDKKWQLAQQICNELKIHAMIEEEIFYPTTKDAVDQSLYQESFVEHDGAKVLINDIMTNGPEDPYFEAKVTVLCEEISHHVKEEERPKEGYFAQVRESDVDLKALRDQLMERKQELMQKAEDGDLPPAQLAAVHLETA